jgi:hypothetical protein
VARGSNPLRHTSTSRALDPQRKRHHEDGEHGRDKGRCHAEGNHGDEQQHDLVGQAAEPRQDEESEKSCHVSLLLPKGETVEHIIEAEPYLAALEMLLRSGGILWVSTPNYGDPWLLLVESTVLELIGRMLGYSRKNMHPTRFSAARLRALLEGVGLDGVQVVKTSFKLALVGVGRKPAG